MREVRESRIAFRSPFGIFAIGGATDELQVRARSDRCARGLIFLEMRRREGDKAKVELIQNSMINGITTIKERRGRSSTNVFTPVSSFCKHGGVLVPVGPKEMLKHSKARLEDVGGEEEEPLSFLEQKF